MDAGQPQNDCPSQLVRAEPRPAPTSLGSQTLPYVSSHDPNICQHFRDREQHEPFNPRKNWSHPRTVMAMGLLLVVLKGPTLSTKHKYFVWKCHKHPRKSSFYFPKCHWKSQRMIEFWCVKSAKMNFKESRRNSITSHWTQGRLPMLVNFSRSVWKKKTNYFSRCLLHGGLQQKIFLFLTSPWVYWHLLIKVEFSWAWLQAAD